MVDVSIHKNPQDETKYVFSRFEEKVFYISHNMALQMKALENKFINLMDVGGSKSEARFDGKLGDSEDP